MVVFAKRPLLLEELSEAVGMASTLEHSDLNRAKIPILKRIKEICAPLIDVYEGRSDGGSNICSLSHATVRSFLLKNPKILEFSQGVKNTTSAIISETIVAEVCFKYLSQPRYMKPLSRRNDLFVTDSGEDISNHYLLSYAAKYWDRHFDHLEYNKNSIERVAQFLQSSNFITCIQVQSLCVEGQFSLWYSCDAPSGGFRRAFPQWFCKNGRSGERFLQKYISFVSEWGHMLDRNSGAPGEIDRCLWNGLGSESFLRSETGRYKNFVIPSVSNSNIGCRYERASEDGRTALEMRTGHMWVEKGVISIRGLTMV
ncbi:MAG: hypothetical protein Q9190_000810 [Brigantiaea leucoxantha]